MKNLELRIKNEEVKAVGLQSSFSILNSQFLICFILATLCSAAIAEPLRFKFQPGDKYLLVSGLEQKISRVVEANERTSEQTMRIECNLEVEEVDESGAAWARYTYKRIVMKMRSKEQKFDFDSDINEPKTPMQVIPFHAALGESIYLRITPQGRIEKINGLQSLVTSAKGKVGSFPGDDIIRRNISGQFDELGVRRMLEEQFAVFPDSNNEGSVWTSKEVLFSADLSYAPRSERAEEVNIIFDKTFRLGKSGQSGISVVDVNLIARPEAAQAANGQASNQSIVASTKAIREISSDGTGQIEIENATGRIINYKMTQDIVERQKLIAKNQMLRPASGPEPITVHNVTTFQMMKITEGKPAPPADANEKGTPST